MHVTQLCEHYETFNNKKKKKKRHEHDGLECKPYHLMEIQAFPSLEHSSMSLEDIK